MMILSFLMYILNPDASFYSSPILTATHKQAHIISTLRPISAAEQEADEENDSGDEYEKVGIESAMGYLEKLSLYELQKDTPNKWNQNDLARILREMEAERVYRLGSQVQQKIDVFLKPR